MASRVSEGRIRFLRMNDCGVCVACIPLHLAVGLLSAAVIDLIALQCSDFLTISLVRILKFLSVCMF